MEHLTTLLAPPPWEKHSAQGCMATARPSQVPHRQIGSKNREHGLTLVEVMVSLTLMATVMLSFISAFVQSRRVTESSVLHAAATSMVYGIVEQIKQLDYATLLPNYEIDPFAPAGAGAPVPPYVRVRINQSTVKWIQVVHTPAPADGSTPTPAAPTTLPAPTATAASVGAVDNFIGAIPLSTVTGTTSQQINLNLWVWIDEIPDSSNDVSEVKKVTIIYTYSYMDGSRERFIRDREVFLRTRFDQ